MGVNHCITDFGSGLPFWQWILMGEPPEQRWVHRNPTSGPEKKHSYPIFPHGKSNTSLQAKVKPRGGSSFRRKLLPPPSPPPKKKQKTKTADQNPKRHVSPPLCFRGPARRSALARGPAGCDSRFDPVVAQETHSEPRAAGAGTPMSVALAVCDLLKSVQPRAIGEPHCR